MADPCVTLQRSTLNAGGKTEAQKLAVEATSCLNLFRSTVAKVSAMASSSAKKKKSVAEQVIEQGCRSPWLQKPCAAQSLFFATFQCTARAGGEPS